MAYMNQARKAKIEKAITPLLNKYNLKGSLRCANHSITLTIRKGPVDFFADMIDTRKGKPDPEPYTFQVNPFWIDSHWDGQSREIFNALNEAMKAGEWYDRSDITTDYFDTAYYYYINVGSWNKPYILVK